MTPYVKRFIEENITTIEQQDWQKVFLEWYDKAEDIWPDEDEFHELIEILKSVGIVPDYTSIHDILYEKITSIMQNAKFRTYPENDNHITAIGVRAALNSSLGLNILSIEDIMSEVAQKLGYRYTDYYGGAYTWL